MGCCAFLGEPQLSIFRCCSFRLGSNFCLQLPAISHLITSVFILSQVLQSLHLAPLSQGSVTPEWCAHMPQAQKASLGESVPHWLDLSLVHACVPFLLPHLWSRHYGEAETQERIRDHVVHRSETKAKERTSSDRTVPESGGASYCKPVENGANTLISFPWRLWASLTLCSTSLCPSVCPGPDCSLIYLSNSSTVQVLLELACLPYLPLSGLLRPVTTGVAGEVDM